MQNIRAYLAAHRPRCTFSAAFSSAHLTYFGTAALEGHGMYSIAAGILLALTVIGYFIGHVEG